MNYIEFLEKYKPIKNTFVDESPFDNCMFETYGEDIEFVKQQDAKHICTIIEEEDSLFILAGYHVVNRYGYLITEEVADFEESITINDGDDDDDDDDDDENRDESGCLHSCIFYETTGSERERCCADCDCYIKEQFKIPESQQELFETYYPNYSSSDDVLRLDDIDRFFDRELDEEQIKEYLHMTPEEAESKRDELMKEKLEIERKLFEKSIIYLIREVQSKI